jgi:hypothetical protein
VYLCYDRVRAGCFEIENPLARWTGAAVEPATPAKSADIGEDAQPGPRIVFYPPVSFGRSAPADRTGPAPSTASEAAGSVRPHAGGLRPTKEDMVQLMERAKRTITGQAEQNLVLGKYATDQPAAGTPVPDCITPGDLWTSPSLRAHAVFHLPPQPKRTAPG